MVGENVEGRVRWVADQGAEQTLTGDLLVLDHPGAEEYRQTVDG